MTLLSYHVVRCVDAMKGDVVPALGQRYHLEELGDDFVR